MSSWTCSLGLEVSLRMSFHEIFHSCGQPLMGIWGVKLNKDMVIIEDLVIVIFTAFVVYTELELYCTSVSVSCPCAGVGGGCRHLIQNCHLNRLFVDAPVWCHRVEIF